MGPIDLDAIEDEWEEAGGIRTPRWRLSRTAREKLERHGIGRVLAVDRGRIEVLLDGQRQLARYAGSMRGEKVVVGDRVRVKPPRYRGDEARVVQRLERDTVLLRTADDAVGDERAVVANADLVVVVLASNHLEGVRFLDRVLVAAANGGLAAAVCVNKVDLEVDVGDVVARYRSIGYSVVTTSARTGAGMEDLRGLLAGNWTALSGHSGVGKSSLVNRLVPAGYQEVGPLGRYGGRHTTAASRALRVDDLDATWLVDTPGVRSFGLGTVDPRELASAFPELRDLPCALDDCHHDGEPGCALDASPEAIHPERLASYRRFLAALRGDGAG